MIFFQVPKETLYQAYKPLGFVLGLNFHLTMIFNIPLALFENTFFVPPLDIFVIKPTWSLYSLMLIKGSHIAALIHLLLKLILTVVYLCNRSLKLFLSVAFKVSTKSKKSV